MKIVGIGGLPRSGKDTLAELFIEHDYYGVSFGDIVREFARERHNDKPDPISVANMTETSNWLRETRGADIILQTALEHYEEALKSKAYEGLVLFSVRAPVEVDWILAHNGELIWVEASDEVRWKRNLKHQREGEPEIDLDEFKRQEALQWQPQPGIPTEVQMNISYVKSHATKVLVNNGNNLALFLENAQKLLAELNN
jgi:dephospho-CoA kinase